MKTRLVIVTMCCVFMSLVSCENQNHENQNQPVVAPQPPCLDISGHITNSDGEPLESILVTLKESDNWWWTEKRRYSDKDGFYSYSQQYEGSDFSLIEWPAEVTIIVTDTAGLYQSQTQTVSIQIRQRYPDSPKLSKYVDGIATADFVLREK